MLSLDPKKLKINQGKMVSQEAFRLDEKRIFSSAPNQKRLSLILGNKTGTIEGITFDSAQEIYDNLNADFVKVSGIIGSYNGKFQIKLLDIENMEHPLDPSMFLPEVENFKELKTEFLATLSEITEYASEPVATLIKTIFHEKFLEKFCKTPAALFYHHSYLGGLMEHTLGVIKNAREISRLYTGINEELVTVGALLHDVGKVDAYIYDPKFKCSPRGTLVGHIVLGCMLISNAILKLKLQGMAFQKEMENLILHIIASHHGEPEKGAPIEPAIIEAQIVHYADELDSKAWMFIHSNVEPGENVRSKYLGRYIYGKQDNYKEDMPF